MSNRKIDEDQIKKIIKIAEDLQEKRIGAPSNLFSQRMGPLISSPASKHFLIKLMDIAFRSKNYARVSGFVEKLLSDSEAYTNLFSSTEKILLRMYKMIGHKLPIVSIPLMLSQIKEVTGSLIFFIGDRRFVAHAEQRRKEGVQLNVNLIGEALIGDKEAESRIEAYLHLLRQPEIDYISVKISTLYAHINSLAYDYTIGQLVKRLSILYEEVLRQEKTNGIKKFVNLDMEEYQDLPMTIDAFMATLSLPQFKELYAGIVLQTYLPDTYEKTKGLQRWADERVRNGGAPIKIRIVKGANMEMEQTEASLEDWPLATYGTKRETDANFKKILLTLMASESLQSVRVGVASHNVFDIAFAIYLIERNNIKEYIDFEMLEGMGNATVKELISRNMKVILYTPIVKEKDYTHAIAYLVRRLDEGTQKGNFLKEGFELTCGSPAWSLLQEQFVDAVEMIDKVSNHPKRKQNRANEIYTKQETFRNVSNTDWVLKENRAWITMVIERWKISNRMIGTVIPVCADAVVESKDRRQINVRNWKGQMPWLYEQADEDDYKQVISNSSSTWYDFSVNKKSDILQSAAVEIEKQRGELIGIGMTELGKTVHELDVEVSEAVDFANYYAQSIREIKEEVGIAEAGGINLVLSPWNFPLAIPIGGVLASLAAGKRVILKPSENAAACAYLLCQCLWGAGVPLGALAFLPTQESVLDPFLSKGNLFDAVILTGSTDTAKFLLDRNPRLKLFAETGGKNATIVTSLADKDQAIKNVIQSAFSNTGQKCSATSLLILEADVFDDTNFKSTLKDAVESIIIGDPFDVETDMGPLSVPISQKLKYAIHHTTDEEWLVKPTINGDFMLSPGVKWGVSTADYEFSNELFGPILSVMKARDLKEAIKLVNKLDFGLTSGIETLDKEEISYWKEHVLAGNLYVNRSTTGAIVQRQPFGGMKMSSFGYGMKAGGPNYVLQFMEFNGPHGGEPLEEVRKSYSSWYEEFFSQEHDYARVRGQHNINRYLVPKEIFVLIDSNTSDMDILYVNTAAEVLTIPLVYYSLDKRDLPLEGELIVLSSWQEIAGKIDHNIVIRALSYETLADDFLRSCHQKAVHICGKKPHPNGRVELLNYLTEQNISNNYHRYGNLMGEKPHGPEV